MQRRRASVLEVVASICAGFAVCAFGPACYDAPRPACGFSCGGGLGCPADYTCAADGRCRLDGTGPELGCPSLDAAIDAEALTPFVIEYVPNGGDSNVAMDVTVTATFNKPVIGISDQSFTVIRQDTTALVAAFVTYDETTRTAAYDPQALLEPSRTYVASLRSDIVDARGRPLTGTTTWVFSIAPDTTPPAVEAVSPIAGAVDVPVDTKIVAAFSEQITSITSASFYVADSTGPIVAHLGYVSQTAVSLTPAVQLAPLTVYSATLTPAIMDFAGNGLAGAPIVWTFTTGPDLIAPVIDSQFPDIDDSDIAITANVIVGFSEPVLGISTTTMTLDQAGTSVPASVTYTPSSRTARLVPTTPLASNTIYTVTLSGSIADAAGNALAPVTWNFATGS